jgi:hypothetical protein
MVTVLAFKLQVIITSSDGPGIMPAAAPPHDKDQVLGSLQLPFCLAKKVAAFKE